MSAVVVAYVPGPQGRAALDRGIVEARIRGLRLVVVNTSRGDALVDERFVQGTALDQLQAELDALDVPAELWQGDYGDDVSAQLERISNETDAALIVIGLRRRTPVGKLILGSAASRILLSVTRPVLAVKGE